MSFKYLYVNSKKIYISIHTVYSKKIDQKLLLYFFCQNFTCKSIKLHLLIEKQFYIYLESTKLFCSNFFMSLIKSEKSQENEFQILIR